MKIRAVNTAQRIVAIVGAGRHKILALARVSIEFQSLLGIELILLVDVSSPKAVQWCWQESCICYGNQ